MTQQQLLFAVPAGAAGVSSPGRRAPRLRGVMPAFAAGASDSSASNRRRSCHSRIKGRGCSQVTNCMVTFVTDMHAFHTSVDVD